jgi:hypothetical protein
MLLISTTTGVNLVHNAPVKLPPAWFFLARTFFARPPTPAGILFFVMGFLTAVGSA